MAVNTDARPHALAGKGVRARERCKPMPNSVHQMDAEPLQALACTVWLGGATRTSSSTLMHDNPRPTQQAPHLRGAAGRRELLQHQSKVGPAQRARLQLCIIAVAPRPAARRGHLLLPVAAAAWGGGGRRMASGRSSSHLRLSTCTAFNLPCLQAPCRRRAPGSASACPSAYPYRQGRPVTRAAAQLANPNPVAAGPHSMASWMGTAAAWLHSCTRSLPLNPSVC